MGVYLEGSVQRAGDEVRVIARVIDARTNREVWSGNLDRDVARIFALQDEIAENVAAALEREPTLVYSYDTIANPAFQPVREDPRFLAIVERLEARVRAER